MYLLRVKDGSSWTTTLVSDSEEITSVVAPIYRGNQDCRVYLFEFVTTLPQPKALAVLKSFDPEDENIVIFWIESTSGAKLFSFRFPLLTP